MANRYLIERYKTSTESEKRNGMRWYTDAHNFCVDVSEQCDVSHKIVAAVVSVLSPRNKWERNKLDAQTLIETKKSGGAMEDFSVCTFTGNKQRAWDLMDLEKSPFDPDKYFKGLKTRCFWDNIVYSNSARVTIDTWAARAAYNTRGNWSRSLKKSEYCRLEKQYISSAKSVGVDPKAFQAIVWVNLRNEVLTNNGTTNNKAKTTVKAAPAQV